jgi:hypothetical protein
MNHSFHKEVECKEGFFTECKFLTNFTSFPLLHNDDTSAGLETNGTKHPKMTPAIILIIERRYITENVRNCKNAIQSRGI